MTVDIVKILTELRLELKSRNAAIAAFEKLGTHNESAVPVRKSNRGRKSMGADERLAVSIRIKRYWASRRALS